MGLLERLGFRSQGSDRGVVGRSVSSYGFGAMDLQNAAKNGYRASAIAYQCIQKIATSAAALDLEVTTGDSEPDLNHPVAQRFNKDLGSVTDPRSGVLIPPHMSTTYYKTLIWQQLEIVGECFTYMDRGSTGSGDLQGLRLIFDPVDVIVDVDYTTVAGYRVNAKRGRFSLLATECMWLRYPNPSEEWGCMSPLAAAASALDADTAAQLWQRSEFQNGANPSAVIYLGDVPDGMREQISAELAAQAAGPKNAGKRIFLNGPSQPKYDRMGLTPVEMSHTESRKANADEIMMAFGLNRDFLYGGSTFQNRREAVIEVWTGTILPKLDIVASQVDLQLLPDANVTAGWDTSKVSALRENEDAIAKRVSILTNADITTINDAREAIDLEPLPNGDLTLTAYRQQFGVAPQMPTIAGGGAGGGGDVALSNNEALQARFRDGLERIWSRLAEKRDRVVERQLSRLQKKNPDSTRAEAVDGRYWTEQATEAFTEWCAQVNESGGRADPATLAGYFVREISDSDRITAEAFSKRVSHVQRAEEARNRRLGPVVERGLTGLLAAFRAQERWLLLNLGARPVQRDALPNPDEEALIVSLINEAIRRGDLGAIVELVQQESMRAAVDTASEDFSLGVSWELVNPKLVNVMDRMALRVKMPEETLRSALQEAINEGLRNGETFQAGIADRVTAVFDGEFNYGALRIARTEALTSYRAASAVSYREAGVEMVELYDGTGDPECAARNGMVVTLDEAEGMDDHPNGSLGFSPLVDLGLGSGSEEAA